MRNLIPLLLFTAAVLAGDASYPLESVAIDGSRVSRDVVLELTGLRIGTPADKETIEAACKKLEDTGIFSSIRYNYAPGPHQGIALTLALVDQSALVDAAVDVPGVDETETWQWIKSRFPAFDHRVPGADAAQQYLARSIELHCVRQLNGHHVAARLESGISGRSLVSFQPEVLPRVAQMTFSGQREFTAEELSRIMQKVVGGEGYMARTYREYLELNVRPAYENHGMYRVKFPSVTMTSLDANSVSVAATIEEGPKYTLGDVQLIGENLPNDDLLAAANFSKGKLANWAEINTAVQQSEKPLRQAGYLRVSTRPERIYDDANHVLNLRVTYRKGPLFHFGNVTFAGFSPNQETTARKMWKLEPGQPFDYTYTGVFLSSLARSAAFGPGRKFGAKSKAGSGENVMDVVITWDAK